MFYDSSTSFSSKQYAIDFFSMLTGANQKVYAEANCIQINLLHHKNTFNYCILFYL